MPIRGNLRTYIAGLIPSGRVRWTGVLSDGTRPFCIATTFRTGSELLVDLLGGQPRVCCDGELLRARPPLPHAFVRGRLRQARRQGFEAYGFKLLAVDVMDLFEPPDRDLVRRLARDGFVFIHLRRRNLLRQAVSFFRASVSQNWHKRGEQRATSAVDSDLWRESFGGLAWRHGSVRPIDQMLEHAPLTIDVPTLFFCMRMIEIQNDAFDWMLEGHVRHGVVYEDDLTTDEARQATVERICRELEVPPSPVEPRVQKIGADDLATDVANVDELRERLAGTRYEIYLEG